MFFSYLPLPCSGSEGRPDDIQQKGGGKGGKGQKESKKSSGDGDFDIGQADANDMKLDKDFLGEDVEEVKSNDNKSPLERLRLEDFKIWPEG